MGGRPHCPKSVAWSQKPPDFNGRITVAFVRLKWGGGGRGYMAQRHFRLVHFSVHAGLHGPLLVSSSGAAWPPCEILSSARLAIQASEGEGKAGGGSKPQGLLAYRAGSGSV